MPPSKPADAPGDGLRGITLAGWSARAYQSAMAEQAVDNLAAIGADHIAILITAYQHDRHASRIYLDSARSPSLVSLHAIATYASSLGMKVTFKLHVDSDDGTWRAMIQPDDPAAWFASYREILLPLASLAELFQGDRFIVGTELKGTTGNIDQWKTTIAAARAVFSGKLLYAASWDEAAAVPFWDDLDEIGVDCYAPVADHANPTRFDILVGWGPSIDRLRHLWSQTGKRIVLTEVGYRSVDGAAMAPYDFTSSARIDPAEQADLYWGALQAIAGASFIEGVYWWNWPADNSGGPTNSDYSPARKPASQELAWSWRLR
ncbi:MAG: hypothetical protein ABIR47_02590 [Candidatus Kapaibacterium sp.]